MFVNGSGRNEETLQRVFHRCFLPSFGSFGQMISVEKNLKNQKQESPVAAMFVNRSGRNEQFYRGPSIDASKVVIVKLKIDKDRKRILELKARSRQVADKGKHTMDACLLLAQSNTSALFFEFEKSPLNHQRV